MHRNNRFTPEVSLATVAHFLDLRLHHRAPLGFNTAHGQRQVPGTPVSAQPQVPGTPASAQPQVSDTPASAQPQVPGTPASAQPQVPGPPASAQPQVPGTPASAQPQVPDTPGSAQRSHPAATRRVVPVTRRVSPVSQSLLSFGGGPRLCPSEPGREAEVTCRDVTVSFRSARGQLWPRLAGSWPPEIC